MKYLNGVFRLLLRVLLWLLIGYWAIFIFHTVRNWVEGGPRLVTGWYADIEGTIFNFNLKLFVIRQLVILGFTVGLFFLDRRLAKRHRAN